MVKVGLFRGLNTGHLSNPISYFLLYVERYVILRGLQLWIYGDGPQVIFPGPGNIIERMINQCQVIIGKWVVWLLIQCFSKIFDGIFGLIQIFV